MVRKPAASPASQALDLEELRKLLRLMDEHHVVELEWEKGQERIHLRTRGSVTAPLAHGGPIEAPRPSMPVTIPATISTSPPVSAPAASSPKPAAAESSSAKQVLSPFVGTFYRSPSPTAEPYAREGQSVKRGDVLCIIEAMKLMNEIESEFTGKIVSVLVENGQPVEFGEPLFLIETK